MGAMHVFPHKILIYSIEKSDASLGQEKPVPFNNNITYSSRSTGL